MPVPTDITAGTLTITNGSTAVTGVGTAWLASDLRQGDVILWIEGGDGFQTPILAAVPASNTALTLVEPWEGPTLTGARYRIRYQWDSSRVSAQSRQLIDLLDNGNVLALTGLTGPGVPVFDGPHSMVIKPETDFINGVAYNVQVDDLAARAAYDGQAEGFAVLVSNVGDGRSAVYSKASNASGDWTDPAFVTGPQGDTPGIVAGTTTTVNPGVPANVDINPDGAGGYVIDFDIPRGEGFTFRGAYEGVTAYALGDVVSYGGSSWIASVATTGNAPPTLPTTSNTWWALLARAGADGTGIGDVVGPPSAVNNRIAVFDGTTGKIIKDSGVTVADVVPADGSITNAKLENMAQATIKGRASGAGSGVPGDLTAAQVLTILAAGGNYQRSNILGTVSQSAGVPTGAIVERGSNANGEYVRFADGTQVCTMESSPSGVTSFSLPAAFADTNYKVAMGVNSNTTTSVISAKIASKSTSSVSLLITASVSGGTVSTPSAPIDCVIVGRWF